MEKYFIDKEVFIKLLEKYVKDKSGLILDYKNINIHKLYKDVDMNDFINCVLTDFKFKKDEILEI